MITWHVTVTDSTGTHAIEVQRPDRADAAPVSVWTPDGWLRGIDTRHVAEGGHCWSRSACIPGGCRAVPEPVPTGRAHLRVVA